MFSLPRLYFVDRHASDPVDVVSDVNVSTARRPLQNYLSWVRENAARRRAADAGVAVFVEPAMRPKDGLPVTRRRAASVDHRAFGSDYVLQP